MDALLAGSTTATTMPIIALAEENQIPLINFAGAVQPCSRPRSGTSRRRTPT